MCLCRLFVIHVPVSLLCLRVLWVFVFAVVWARRLCADAVWVRPSRINSRRSFGSWDVCASCVLLSCFWCRFVGRKLLLLVRPLRRVSHLAIHWVGSSRAAVCSMAAFVARQSVSAMYVEAVLARLVFVLPSAM